MNALRCTVLASGTILSAAAVAHAEVAPGGWVDTRIVGSQLEVRDTSNGRALVGRETLSMFAGFPAGVTTDVVPTPAVDGTDLRFTFRNTTGSAKRLGRIYVGILNLGADIEYFNFRHTSTPTPAHTTSHIGWAAMYPDDLYSPVAVLRNDDMAVGLSMQYPVMDYQHDVRIEISSPGNWLADGEAGRGWLVSFGLGNINQEAPHSRIQYEAELAPGEERVYTISMRFTKNAGEWQKTLVPYRDFFRETYGPVKYQRRTTPVLGYALADPGAISTINPQGYRANHRPDLNGFGGVLRELDSYINWPTIMLWAPTGLYRTNRELNWPYQFATRWNVSPQQQTAFAPTGFPSIPARGQTLGMWWGRSLGLAERWDTNEYTPFDPENQRHRAIGFAELDAAAQAGATEIGLDTYGHHVTPIWKSRQWLRDMQSRHPEMRFVTEPSMCDIMHVEAPTFISGWNAVTSRPASRSDLYNITTPNYLADFLLPGHETWGAYRYSEHTRFFGAPTDEQVRADMEYVASLGYRPCFMIDYFTPQGVTAAQSWESSVPQSLRDNDAWMEDIREGRRPGQDADQAAGPGPGSGEDAGGGAGGSDAGSDPFRRTRPGSLRSTNGVSALRRNIIRVQQGAGSGTLPQGDTGGTPPQQSAGNSGGGTDAAPPRRMSTNWREMIRRNAQYRVQHPKGAGERLRDQPITDAGGD